MALHTLLINPEGILFEPSQSAEHLRSFLANFDLELRHPKVVQKALKAAFYDVMHGRISREEFYDATLRFHGLPDEALDGGRTAMLRDAKNIQMIPGASDGLGTLRDMDFRLVLAMNSPHASADIQAWLEAVGFPGDLWERIFVSCEIGSAEPDPAFFKAILEALELDWSDIAYLRRNPELLTSAMSEGLLTIALEPEPDKDFEVHHVVNSFDALIDLLDQLRNGE